MLQSPIENRNPNIVIAGAGPAGAGLAIRLAQSGFETVLVEKEKFPRQKLCGEFISPECFSHFESLGVLENMFDAGGDRITETRFFETRGRSVVVPTSWFGRGDFALSLSRAEMDDQLLERAKAVGVTVREATTVVDAETVDGRVGNLKVRDAAGETSEIAADIFVDATGRSRIIAKLLEKKERPTAERPKPTLVGFKTHMKDVDIANGVCEIYSFPGGYAGLSHVENGLFNLCFLLKASTVKSAGSDADEIVRNIVTKNKRASVTLRAASSSDNWLAVSIDSFGTKAPAAAGNLFTVGDAAAFIDPFTGSGMVMAFESAELLANSIIANGSSPERIAAEYGTAYQKKFANRLRVCSLLRRTAFMPNLATGIVSLLAISTTARRGLARATRSSVSD
ncbi:MAG TPA: NAD(P)/FAD-dependent oxidoreductase [Pyrinomonadaceae bacterium]|nr:NAD(P)/FAD-dependent oxidoreductase [Pyrinomonadaceae bacterium]